MEPPRFPTGSAAKRRHTLTRLRPLVQRNLDTSDVYDLRCRVILDYFMSKSARAERFGILLCLRVLVQTVLANFYVGGLRCSAFLSSQTSETARAE